MQYSKTLALSVALLASSAFAELKITSIPQSIQAGKPVKVTYTADNIGSPVQVILRGGDPKALETYGTILTATGGEFTLDLSDYPNASNYAIEIQQGGQSNYSGLISLGGSTATAIPGASKTETAASSATKPAASSKAASSASESSESESSKSVSSKASATASGRSTTTETSTDDETSTTATRTATRTSSTSDATAAATTSDSGAAIVASGSSSVALVIGAIAAFFI